jgi:hypothetical protein
MEICFLRMQQANAELRRSAETEQVIHEVLRGW